MMLGEKPVRQRVTPISSAMETKKFLKISNLDGVRTHGACSESVTRIRRTYTDKGQVRVATRVPAASIFQCQAGGMTLVDWPVRGGGLGLRRGGRG